MSRPLRLEYPDALYHENREKDRDSAILAAYASGRYSYMQIGEHFGIHFTTVGRIVREKRL